MKSPSRIGDRGPITILKLNGETGRDGDGGREGSGASSPCHGDPPTAVAWPRMLHAGRSVSSLLHSMKMKKMLGMAFSSNPSEISVWRSMSPGWCGRGPLSSSSPFSLLLHVYVFLVVKMRGEERGLVAWGCWCE